MKTPIHTTTWRLVVAISSLTVFAQGPALASVFTFSDDFNNGASAQWGNQSGNWAANGGVYQALSPSSTAYSALPFTLTDFSVDVDINNVADGGIWLRSDATGQNGLLLVTGGEGWGWGARTAAAGASLYFQVVQNGSYGPYLGEVTGLFNPTVDSPHIRVEVQGDSYSVFLNGDNTPVTSITDSTFSSGLVGLYDFSSQSFDNFVLQAVPEPSAWALMGLSAVGIFFLRRRK